MSVPFENEWSQIVRRRSWFFAIILPILRHRHDAEEALQEALIKMYLALKRGRPVRQLESWTDSIARNTAIDRYRKRRRDRIYCVSDLADECRLDPPAPNEQWEAEMLMDLRSQLSGLNATMIDELDVTTAENGFSRACNVRRLQLAAIASLIADLPLLQAKVLEMKILKGMSTEAIAQETGFDPKNIRSNSRRGLKTLTARLERCRG